jgi:hypothetical protein
MNKNLSNEELVNSYLDNELSDIERLDFENRLVHDSGLKEEFNFQKELVEGIRESRRLELKSRLSNIPINTPLFQTVGFKAIAVASISAGIGFGAYFIFNEDDNGTISEITLNEQSIASIEEKSIPEVPEAITPIEIEKDESEIKKETPQEKPKTEAIAKNTEIKPEIKVVEPNVIQPDIVEVFEDGEIASNDLGNDDRINGIEDVKEHVESTVEIATIKDKRNKFHYKFYENKLYLLGNFDEMPYEIIELNSTKGKSYFLYYNDSYFRLLTKQEKATPLIKIENDSLVNELRIIQSNLK